MKVGVIGLGIMGKPMAINLLKAGFSVSIYARKPNVITELTRAGAQSYATPQALAAAVDVLITNVTDTQAVAEILFGENGVVLGAKPGTVVIDMSTIAASDSREFATCLQQSQIDMLDAPVSGGEQGAIAATLVIMVGGPAAIVAKMQPLFAALGKTIVHVGESHGAGQVAKACNQLILAQTITAIGEAQQLAQHAAVDFAKVREALLGGFAQSRVLEIHGKRLLENNFTPGFKAQLHNKDLQIALREAMQMGLALPATAYCAQLLNAAVKQGHAEQDSSVLALFTQKINANIP